MDEMKTLTVNGKTYTVADPDAAHINDAAINSGNAWSSKTIIDRLCPGFTVSGPAVSCHPVAGYPLQVTTELPASDEGYAGVALYMRGKNLYDKDSYPLSSGMINHTSGVWSGNSGSNFCGTGGEEGYIPVAHLVGQSITLNHPANEGGVATNGGVAFYDATKTFIPGSGFLGSTGVVPEGAAYMRFCVQKVFAADGSWTPPPDIQIEIGSEVTQYEPFLQGDPIVVDFNKTVYGGSFNWVTGVLTDENGEQRQLDPIKVQALPGTTTLYSSAGNTSVTGRWDLITILEEMAKAIASLNATNAALLEG